VVGVGAVAGGAGLEIGGAVGFEVEVEIGVAGARLVVVRRKVCGGAGMVVERGFVSAVVLRGLVPVVVGRTNGSLVFGGSVQCADTGNERVMEAPAVATAMSVWSIAGTAGA